MAVLPMNKASSDGDHVNKFTYEQVVAFFRALEQGVDEGANNTLEFMRALERGLENDVMKFFREINTVLSVVLHFVGSSRRRLRDAMRGEITDASGEEETTGGASAGGGGVGVVWETNAAKLREFVESIDRISASTCFRHKVLRIRRAFPGSVERVNERSRKVATRERKSIGKDRTAARLQLIIWGGAGVATVLPRPRIAVVNAALPLQLRIYVTVRGAGLYFCLRMYVLGGAGKCRTLSRGSWGEVVVWTHTGADTAP